MLKILFVDDEPNVLQATRRATRDMRHEWDIRFAQSGADAMTMLDEEAFDVVVSDMRMPGIDGAELLMHVRVHSPSTARIILSGYAEEEAVFRSTRVAHQFLSKPCDVDDLKRTIAEIRAAQEAVSSAEIRDLIGSVEQLPALGEVYQRLTSAIESGQANNQQLAEIVSEDVALTAEILRLLNSSFFGLSRRVESVAQAIGFLGVDVLRAIVAGHAVFNQCGSSAVDVDAISRRSQQVAALARRLHGIRSDAVSSELANIYMAGMLHEIGSLVISAIDGTDRLDIEGAFTGNDATVDRLVFGADRFAVSSYLLGLWAFPPEIVQAVGSLSQPPDPSVGLLAWSLTLARHIVVNGLLTEDTIDDDAGLEALANRVETELIGDATPSPVEVVGSRLR